MWFKDDWNFKKSVPDSIVLGYPAFNILLCFVLFFKLITMVVGLQLQRRLDEVDYFDPIQLGFTPEHVTETFLDDLLW